MRKKGSIGKSGAEIEGECLFERRRQRRRVPDRPGPQRAFGTLTGHLTLMIACEPAYICARAGSGCDKAFTGELFIRHRDCGARKSESVCEIATGRQPIPGA